MNRQFVQMFWLIILSKSLCKKKNTPSKYEYVACFCFICKLNIFVVCTVCQKQDTSVCHVYVTVMITYETISDYNK